MSNDNDGSGAKNTMNGNGTNKEEGYTMDMSHPMFLSMMNKNGSNNDNNTFHPDFVNCGDCVSCMPVSETAETGMKTVDFTVPNGITNGMSNNKTQTNMNGILHTVLLCENLQEKAQVVVIQSVLQPIDGVEKVVVNVTEKLVLIDHDARTDATHLLETLQTLGYQAVMQEDNDGDAAQAEVVRSQFYVQGICCASECPSIQKTVSSLNGVHKISINITTKMVYVQHNPNAVDAHEVALALHGQGFDTRVVKDGAAVKAALLPLAVGRTTLHMDKVLHKNDIVPIQRALGFLKGVKRVGVNCAESVVYVEHYVGKISAAQLSHHLYVEYPNAIAADAADEIQLRANHELSSARSKFVESTLRMSNLTLSHVALLEKSFRQNYIPAQLRAFYPHVPSKTVKVEHNPGLLQAEAISTMLQRIGMDTTVTIDGAVEHLTLPLLEDYETPIYGGMGDSYGASSTLHINVLLSGLFWFISILSYVPGENWDYLKYAGLLSVLFGIPPVAVKAWRTLRRCQFDANCMMVTAAFGALALGEFDEAASVAFLFAVSEFLEAKASYRARKALGAIVSLKPEHAHVIHPTSKEIIITPAERVPVGSLISIRTGDKIAADGVVVDGTSAVDESSLTGEALPVSKQTGDTVAGGSINIGSSPLQVRTTSSVDDSAVSRLVRLVEEAQANRSPTEQLVDAFAKRYTPVVMLMAIGMCTIPWFISPELGRYWTLNGLIIIVIACPCALTISTPVTYAAGLAACAQRGVIVKGGASLENLGSVDKVIFDKTGTLTKGQFVLNELKTIGSTTSRKTVLELLHLLESPSSHPLSNTLVRAAREEGVGIKSVHTMQNHTVLKGEGVTALVDGTTQVYVGNQRLFERLGMYQTLDAETKSTFAEWHSNGGTVGFIGTVIEGSTSSMMGAFCVTDEIRPEAKEIVKSLLDGGIEVIMLTGDGDGAAKAVAKQIGLPESAVKSQLLPEDKLHYVGSLISPKGRGDRCCSKCNTPKSLVMMVGDGINDAPALAVADIGVAMGEGAALAMEMSDITLMDCNLNKLVYTIQMGTRVVVTIQENIFLSLLAKTLVVGLTFVGRMTLLSAIAADVGIMLIVTLNGIKLLPASKEKDVELRRDKKRRIDLHHSYNQVLLNNTHGSEIV